MTPDEWMKALGSLPLSYPPGERFHYGHSTDVLGFMVGRIEGMPFRDVLMKRIFGPLGMKDTDFWIPPEKRGRAAALYNFDEAAETLIVQPGLPYEAPPAFAGGGGSLVSTVEDYLKFARVMVRDGTYDGVTPLKARNCADDAHQPVDAMRSARSPSSAWDSGGRRKASASACR